MYAVAALAADPAMAQFGGPFGGGMGRGPGMGGAHGGPRGADERPVRRPSTAEGPEASGAELDQRLDNVRYQLRLSSEQEGLWLAYREKVAALVADHSRPSAPVPASANAVAQIGRKVDLLRNRLTAMEDIADIARALYERLDERQRGVADRLLPATVPNVAARAGGDEPSNFGGFGGTQSRMDRAPSD